MQIKRSVLLPRRVFVHSRNLHAIKHSEKLIVFLFKNRDFSKHLSPTGQFTILRHIRFLTTFRAYQPYVRNKRIPAVPMVTSVAKKPTKDMTVFMSYHNGVVCQKSKVSS